MSCALAVPMINSTHSVHHSLICKPHPEPHTSNDWVLFLFKKKKDMNLEYPNVVTLLFSVFGKDKDYTCFRKTGRSTGSSWYDCILGFWWFLLYYGNTSAYWWWKTLHMSSVKGELSNKAINKRHTQHCSTTCSCFINKSFLHLQH